MANELSELFVVRQWDWFDGWFDVTGPVTKEIADVRWKELTKNGTDHCDDRWVRSHYYCIFPADTTMLYSSEVIDRID